MTAPNQKLAYRIIDATLRSVLRLAPPSRLAQSLALTWGYRFQPRQRTIRLRSGLLFRYERADFIPLLLHYTGTFEPRVIELLSRLVEPGDVVVDVGANIGFHSLESWRATGPRGKVISIEASPHHATALRRNLELNGLPTDNVINVAVGDHDGDVTLGLPTGGNQGMFGINAGTESAFTVRLTRIDDLLATKDLSKLALVKLDIEGSELGALHGARETLRKHQPAILIELNDTALTRCGASSAEVVRFLEEAGYIGWAIADGALRAIVAKEPHECDECIFLHVDDDKNRKKLLRS